MGILERFSLEGKVAVVTGGAGKYGRQILAALAEAGATTYVASRNLKALEAVAAEHRTLGQDVTALQYDQGDEKSILALRDEILKRSGQVDVLVNNSVARVMKSYDDTAAAFEGSMHVNATGLFLITRALGDVMAERGKGSIINIGSIYGMVGTDPTNYTGTTMGSWVPDYYFHKGGMINFTRFLGSYYGPKGIRCNCVSPGGFWEETMPEVFVRNYSSHTFMGRLANTSDLMGIIVLLASDASSYITGVNVPVDGGYTAR
jgi:NAD(P)-dependent dehydrogenase (short-subunit alcohol dehydrogenase family)